MDPYRTKMKAVIKKIGYDYDIEIIELEIPEVHTHMLIPSNPKQSPSDVMQIVKNITPREFFRIYPEIKKNTSWEVSCRCKATLWKQLETKMKKKSENIGGGSPCGIALTG